MICLCLSIIKLSRVLFSTLFWKTRIEYNSKDHWVKVFKTFPVTREYSADGLQRSPSLLNGFLNSLSAIIAEHVIEGAVRTVLCFQSNKVQPSTDHSTDGKDFIPIQRQYQP